MDLPGWVCPQHWELGGKPHRQAWGSFREILGYKSGGKGGGSLALLQHLRGWL